MIFFVIFLSAKLLKTPCLLACNLTSRVFRHPPFFFFFSLFSYLSKERTGLGQRYRVMQKSSGAAMNTLKRGGHVFGTAADDRRNVESCQPRLSIIVLKPDVMLLSVMSKLAAIRTGQPRLLNFTALFPGPGRV